MSAKARHKVMIYDTTLRDGTQGEGISFSSQDKVQIAKLMDEFRIDYIEGGWPGSNPRDMDFFESIRSYSFNHSKLAAFGSTRKAGVAVEDDSQLQTLLAAQTPVVTIFGKSWTLHVTEVLKTSLEENLSMIKESVAFLKSRDKEVIYDAEHFFDGFKADPTYAESTLQVAIDGGADYIVLCDTNGGTQVDQLQKIIKHVAVKFPKTNIGVHCHNDCGLGVALSISGVQEGASMVQGTMNGFGERIGNANLTTIIPNLTLKLEYPLSCSPILKKLKEFSNAIDEYAHRIPSKKEPFVGKSAFAHKGGVHANAAKKVACSYEHMSPEAVGNEQRILLSDMSGGSSVAMKAQKLGVYVDEKSLKMKSFLDRIKRLENEGHSFENADASFYLLLHEHFYDEEDIFNLISYRIISEVVRGTSKNISEAVLKLKLNGNNSMTTTVAESTGPVSALDHAARQAFGQHFPILKDVKLDDYKVRILQRGMGTDSITQVLIKSSDQRNSWWTCGADSNILEASWMALKDSYRYRLLKDKS